MRNVGENVIIKKKKQMLKKLQENQKENDNDVDADVAQLERSNNKCYVSAFRYIYIYIDVFCIANGMNY